MDGIFGKRFLWPFSLCPLAWKCNHTVAQLRKYLHKFWFKSLQWFRSYLSSHDYYGLVLGLQKNFQTRSGITEASIEFLRSIVTRALLIARKAAEDPWLRWQTMWLKLQLCQSQDNKPGTNKSQRQAALTCYGDGYSECWTDVASIHSRECEHQQ